MITNIIKPIVIKTGIKSFKFYLFIIGILFTSVLKAQNFLDVPVKVDIENGNIEDVLIKVIKNGRTTFTQSSTSKLRLKLNFNCIYTIVFSKPGYVTKTVEFDTKAPKEHIADGFDPYKIEVKLFQQFDGVNLTVFNQPVGKIRYNKELDEFDYDTDYTKSILSNLQAAEKELAAKSEHAKKSDTHVQVMQLTDDQAKNDVDKSEKKSNSSTLINSTDYKEMLDPVIKENNASLINNGDINEKIWAWISALKQDANITIREIDEKTRIITIVRVTKGKTTTEYRRVSYPWGGPFYFKNVFNNISEDYFVYATTVME